MIELLLVGHIVVDTVKDKATFSFQPTIVAPRFDPAAFERLAPRFVTALAFQEAFRDIPGDPRHGGHREGRTWLAKAVRENLQWNCWWDEAARAAYCGINMERKSEVVANVGAQRSTGCAMWWPTGNLGASGQRRGEFRDRAPPAVRAAG